MPLLKRGTEIFPAHLFELPEAEFPWWIAQTRSRREKTVARHLEDCGVPFYLPQREKKIRRAGRVFVSYLPLFGGYLFFRGADRERLAALRSNMLARVLPVAAQELLGVELSQLRALQEAGASLLPCVPVLRGQSVRVTDGPFSGYTGVVLQEKGRQRLVVSVTALRKDILVEFERDILAPVASRRALSTA